MMFVKERTMLSNDFSYSQSPPTDATTDPLDDLGPDLLPKVLGGWLIVTVGLDRLQAREKVHLGRVNP